MGIRMAGKKSSSKILSQPNCQRLLLILLTDGIGEGAGITGACGVGAGGEEKGPMLGNEHEQSRMKTDTTAISVASLNRAKVFLLGQGSITFLSFSKSLIKIYEEVSDHPLFLCEEGYPLARPTSGGKLGASELVIALGGAVSQHDYIVKSRHGGGVEVPKPEVPVPVVPI